MGFFSVKVLQEVTVEFCNAPSFVSEITAINYHSLCISVHSERLSYRCSFLQIYFNWSEDVS